MATMKKLALLVILLAFNFHVLSAQTIDTLVGRSPDYYYYGWYDQCHRYGEDTNGFVLRHFSQHLDPSFPVMYIMEEQYVPEPTTIKGVAVMVSIDPGSFIDVAQSMPSTDSLRLPEYIYVFQGGNELPGLPLYYYPRQLTLVDSAQWNGEIQPKVMALPLSRQAADLADTSRTNYCYIYEVLFDTPITVHDTFYIAGTYWNNYLDCYQDTVYEGDEMYVFTRCERYRHFPTVYTFIRDYYEDPCDKCPIEDRLFFFPDPPNEELMEVYNWNNMISGPFLPILDEEGGKHRREAR